MFRKRSRLPLAVTACLALAALFAAVALSGCDASSGPTGDSLVGVWSSTFGDGFTVTETTFRYQFEGVDQFVGDIANDPDLSAGSGYVVMRITSRLNSWDPEVGKYVAIHWTNLTGDGVREANAYKTGGSYNSGMDTLAEAEAEYTVANGYYGQYGEYLREE